MTTENAGPDAGPAMVDAVVEAICESQDWTNPMVTNASGVEFLTHLWRLGFTVMRARPAGEEVASDPIEAYEQGWCDALREAGKAVAA